MCISSVAFELFTKIIEQSTAKAAFQPNRQINVNLSTVKGLLKLKIGNGKTRYQAFIDLRPAFDVVARNIIWEIL